MTSLKCRKFTHEQLRKLITQIEGFGDHKLKGLNEKKTWYDELVQMFPPHTRTALIQKVNMLRMKMSESNKTRFGPWPVEEKAYTNRLIQVLPPTFPLHPPPPTHTHILNTTVYFGQEFIKGLLPLDQGTDLSCFLSSILSRHSCNIRLQKFEALNYTRTGFRSYTPMTRF